jgi:hypothetical protein
MEILGQVSVEINSIDLPRILMIGGVQFEALVFLMAPGFCSGGPSRRFFRASATRPATLGGAWLKTWTSFFRRF